MAFNGEHDPDYHDYVLAFGRGVVNDVNRNTTIPDLQLLEKWHKILYGPVADDPRQAGKIRQLDHKRPWLNVNVRIGQASGVAAAGVPQAMKNMTANLRSRIVGIDNSLSSLSKAQLLRNVVELAAWAHGEIVRIHPFCNGNGRIARFLASFLFHRYKIPFTVSVKPRPVGDYSICADSSMKGDHKPIEGLWLREIALMSYDQS